MQDLQLTKEQKAQLGVYFLPVTEGKKTTLLVTRTSWGLLTDEQFNDYKHLINQKGRRNV